MKQIKKHDWKPYRTTPFLKTVKCKYCKAKKVTSQLDGDYLYITGAGIESHIEPACITRKKTEDGL